jgi:FKBP-type peptidyl-prolyl cis-trans isomerase FklB
MVCASAFAADPVVSSPVAANAKPPAAGSNLIDRGSYAFGATLGNNLRMQGADPNVEQVLQGFRDAINGKMKMPETELRENYMAWMREVRTQKMEKNKKAGEDFLAKKAAEPGVKKFPDGLLYKVLAAGKGPQPKNTDRVSAHYKGTLIDGAEFDSSYTRGKPFETQVRNVIPGWQEALTNMHVGDKWELYVPSQLAYGERGAGAKIGPNSALVFEMELLSILPPETNNVLTTPTLNLNTPAVRNPTPGAKPQIQVRPAK